MGKTQDNKPWKHQFDVDYECARPSTGNEDYDVDKKHIMPKVDKWNVRAAIPFWMDLSGLESTRSIGV